MLWLPQVNGPFSNNDQPVTLLVGVSFTSDVVESGRPQAPPDKAFDIIKCGREIQNSIPVPVIAKGELATPELRVLGQRERSASLMSCNWSVECG